MKIAIIAPLIERVPPRKYGGTERVIYHLTEELVRRGHDVTLFASGDSETSAKLVSVYPINLREANLPKVDIYGANMWNVMNIAEAYGRHKEFDIIHDHTANPAGGYISLPVAQVCPTPTVLTLHNPLTPEDNTVFEKISRPYVVTISESQGRPTVNLNYAGVVYNGLKMDDYPFSAEHEGYLLFVGRISPQKGVHYAIQAAKELGMRLIIAAKLDPIDQDYFKEKIEPELSEQIKWIGEVDEKQRNELMSKALAYLHPVAWPEPFGLVLIEAMACGCPVIAFNQGSIPEIVKDGKTGFVVRTVEEMKESIKHVTVIDRKFCRQYALEHFSAARMADGYEKVYHKIIEEQNPQPQP